MHLNLIVMIPVTLVSGVAVADKNVSIKKATPNRVAFFMVIRY